MKEIKVRLYHGENDYFVELWEVVEEMAGIPKYFGRYTYGNEGTWYFVSDPLGYCELDHAVSDDVVFILCDEDGNECMRYSNADKNPLPKFEDVMKKKWKEVCKNIEHNTENMTANFWAEAYNGETTLSINQWLLTFKDPDLYKKEIDEMFGYDENWTGCLSYKEIAYEAIPGTEFEYLGKKYQFTKVTLKHDVCGAEWIEYRCTDAPYVMQDTFWIKDRIFINSYGYLGNWFDKSNVGAMMDKRSARKLVETKLLEVIPKEKKYGNLLYISGNYCYEKSYSDAAESLIGRDFHRSKVIELANNLKEKTKNIVFVNSYANKQKIKELYPDIYGYNWCLI